MIDLEFEKMMEEKNIQNDIYYRKLINSLIHIGQKYSFLSIEDVNEDDNLNLMSSKDQNNIYNYFYPGGPHGYSASELSDLLKGIAVCEIKMMNHIWGYGSVSATVAVTFALYAVDDKQAHMMINWLHIFGFRSYYFGYSRVNSKSEELLKYILKHSTNDEAKESAKEGLRAYNDYRQAIKDRETYRSEKAKEKQQYTAQLVLNDLEDRGNLVRENLIRELEILSDLDKLILMANDKRHSIKFYPKNLAYQTTEDDIKKLSFEQQKNLVQMSNIKMKGYTPWGGFKKKLHNVVSYR